MILDFKQRDGEWHDPFYVLKSPLGELLWWSSSWDFALQCRECGFEHWLES